MSTKDKNQNKNLSNVIQTLTDGVKAVFESEQYINYLKVMAKFHNYSFANNILIHTKCPHATYVAGFRAWQQKFKRKVNKGEKGIPILAPLIINNNDDENKDNILLKFRIVYVFDVTQTSGKPLEDIFTPLEGNVEIYSDFMDCLHSISPFKIEFTPLKGGAKGSCNFTEERIIIKKGLSQIHSIKTAIHEIAHARLHCGEKNTDCDRQVKEVEAESVAYVVCQHFGIDTSTYSFPYIGNWSQNKELLQLKKSLATIQKTARKIIDDIEIKMSVVMKVA